jgi:hypothetical protein
MAGRRSDYTFHPPSSGSNVPGKIDANPYLQYPPQELRKLLEDLYISWISASKEASGKSSSPAYCGNAVSSD